MKPESGTCRECKIFNDHLIIDGNYICSKCGFVTKIITWEEARQTLDNIEQRWLEIEKNHPQFFRPERLNSVKGLLTQVENGSKNTGLN